MTRLHRSPMAAISAAVGLALVLAFGSTPTLGHAFSAHDEIGLGDYGPTGLITRDLLPDGIDDLVKDEAIALANSLTFAQARSSWDVSIDFVDQIDYQLEFRSHVDFMTSNIEYLANLLETRPQNDGIESMGLFMADDEVAEMQRRDELGDRMEDVVAFVVDSALTDTTEGTTPSFGPAFGGIWQDQLDGGKVVLAVTEGSQIDRTALDSIVGGAENLKVVEQPYSYDEIEIARNIVDQYLEDMEIPADILAIRSDAGTEIEIRVADPDALKLPPGLPSGLFTVVTGPVPSDTGYPSATHSLADQQPGLQVYITGTSNNCTWGHNGHTTTYNYIVSAGHCFGSSDISGYTSTDVWQNGSSSRNLTSGSTYLYSLKNSSTDAARISSGYADDNCYHGNQAVSSPSPHCGWPISSRALWNQWEVGSDRSCASLGTSNTYRCGYVTDMGVGTGDHVVVEMQGSLGDSGSGMKWDYRIDGILTSIAHSPERVLFEQAYEVKSALGFDFNCGSGKTVHSTPSGWGTCPATNP